MKISLLTLLLTISNSYAGWWATTCSSANQDFSYEESKMGQELVITTVRGDYYQRFKKTLSFDYSSDNELIVEVEDKNIQGETNTCEDYYYEDSSTYSAKITFTQSNGDSFPEGTLNTSKDGKVLSLYMICEDTSAGRGDCEGIDE